MDDLATARLLQFVAKGFLHGVSNSVFAVQSRLQVLGSQRPGEYDEMLTACKKVTTDLEVFRTLVETPVSGETVAAGPLLATVVNQLRIAVGDAGVTLQMGDKADRVAWTAPRGAFVRAVASAVEATCRALPTGFEGRIEVDWSAPSILQVRLIGAPEQLPFDVDLTTAAQTANAALVPAGGTARRIHHGVELCLTGAKT